MLRTVELDNQLVRKANDIDDVGADGRLAAKLAALELFGAQQPPEALFGLGQFVAKTSGEVALFAVAVHGAINPLPSPPPKGEGVGTWLRSAYHKGEGAGTWLKSASHQGEGAGQIGKKFGKGPGE